MLQTTRLAISADSLGLSEQFLKIFTKLLDVISQNNENLSRHSRHISSKGENENFFYTLQQIKRGASPELSQLIDNAIISDPSINSFESLWNYLSQNSSNEIQPYISELLSLFAKHSIEEYFNLTETQKELVYEQATKQEKDTTFWIAAIGFLIASSLLYIILLARKKRRKNQNQSRNS